MKINGGFKSCYLHTWGMWAKWLKRQTKKCSTCCNWYDIKLPYSVIWILLQIMFFMTSAVSHSHSIVFPWSFIVQSLTVRSLVNMGHICNWTVFDNGSIQVYIHSKHFVIQLPKPPPLVVMDTFGHINHNIHSVIRYRQSVYKTNQNLSDFFC